MTNYLSIQNLRKVYHDNGKKFVALDDVSFNRVTAKHLL